MAESKVKRDNFITIQGFMLTELGLKGNELIIYAIILNKKNIIMIFRKES